MGKTKLLFQQIQEQMANDPDCNIVWINTLISESEEEEMRQQVVIYNSKRLMSHFERNTRYLERHRIIYRRDPITDKPTETFEWGSYFEEGTRECYTLFNSRARINTFRSLKWHLYVLWYLNPKMDPDSFNSLTYHICEKRNGFVTFNVPEPVIQRMIYDVSLMDLESFRK